MSRVDDYLKNRKSRMEEPYEETSTVSEATRKAGGVSGKSKTVKNYLKKFEEEGRYRRDVTAYNAADWEETKKNLGFKSFTPSKETMDLAREFARRRKKEQETREKQKNLQRMNNGPTYTGSMGTISYADIKRDPEFEKYREEGSEDLFGLANDWIGQLKQAAMTRGTKEGWKREFLTEEEKDMYNYMLGKYGKEEAETFMDSLSGETADRLRQEETKAAREAGERSVLGGVGYNLLGAATSPKGYLYAAAKTAGGKLAGRDVEVDLDDEAFGGNAIMEASAEGLKENIGGTPVRDFLIDTGLSMGQTLTRLPLGVLGAAAAAGGSAATGAYVDARERGASNERALAQGTAQGAAETAFEKISLGNLKALKEVPGRGLKNVAKNLGKQALVEGSEEMATEVANTLTDRLIMKDRSVYDSAVQEYESQGMTPEEARRVAVVDAVKNVALAGAGGALSGGIMGGGAQGLSLAQEYVASKGAKPAVTVTEPTEHVTEPMEIVPKSEEIVSESKKIVPKSEEIVPESEKIVPKQEKITPENIMPERNREEELRNQEAEEQRKAYIEKNRTDLEEVFRDLGERGKVAAVEQYDPDVSLPEYRRAFNRYYDAGRYNAGIESAEESAASALLTGDQALAAFKAGAQDRHAEQQAMKVAKVQGEKHEGKLVNRAEHATGAQKRVAEALGKRTGLTFVLEDNLDSGAVGEYDSGKGTIHVSTNSKNFLRTNTHELTHFLKENAGEKYNYYRDAVIMTYVERDGRTLEQLTESYERAYEKQGQKLTRDEIMEEIVADATGEFWNDPEFIDKIVKKDRTIAQKIVDFLSDVVDAIKELITRENLGPAAEALSKNKKDMEFVREMWMEALDEAGENYRNGSGNSAENVRYKLEKPELVTAEKIEENYDYVRKMDSVASIKGDEFRGEPKEIRNKITELYNSYGNVVHNNAVGDIILTGRSVRSDLAHGYGNKKAAAFATVKQVLENGKVLRFSENWKGRGYNAVIIGAKVDITEGTDAGEYYEVCVVKVNEDNRMYLHEIDIEKADSVPFNYGRDEPNKHRGYDYLPISSIFEKLRNVNGKNTVKKQIEHPEMITDEKIQENIEAVRNMDPLMELEGTEFADWSKKKPSEQVEEFYNSIGNKVYNDVIGEVVLNRKSVKNDIAHGIGRIKAITFGAVPTVIEKGKVINIARNWKGRNYDSVAVGGKISIKNDGDYYVVCMLNVDSDNRMYLHEAEAKRMDDLRSKTRSANEGQLSGANHPSIYSIFDKLQGVNRNETPDLKDVRFQLDDFDTVIDIEEVMRENSELKAINENLKRQMQLTRSYKPRQEDVSKFAGKLLKDYNSDYSKKKLEENLSKLYEYMRTARRLDMQEVSKVSAEIARSVLEKSNQIDSDEMRYYKTLADDIKKTSIYVPEEVRKDLDTEGGYNAFRKRYMGRITFRNNGVSVDNAYEELAGLHPEAFPLSITNPTDQLLRIADVLQEAKPKISNPYEADLDEMSVLVGEEILEYRANIRNIPPTMADKIFEKADQQMGEAIMLQREYKKKMREYRGEVRERESARTAKKQIVRDVTKMQRWLLSPSDSEHIPESLRMATVKFLSCIDYSSNQKNQFGEDTQRTKDWLEAQKIYQGILHNEGILKTETGEVYVELDPDIGGNIETLIKGVQGISRMEDMSMKEVIALRDTVAAMKAGIENVNKMYTNKRYQTASECAKSSVEEWKRKKNQKTLKTLKNADNMMRVHMLDSFSVFGRLGKAANSTLEALRRGFDQKIRDTRTAQEYMEKLKQDNQITQKDLREWTGKNAKKQTFQVEGGELTLTPGQIMSIYCLSKRKQAQEHLYNKNRGIRTKTTERDLTIRGKKILKLEEASEPVCVTPMDVSQMVGTLDEKQKAFADGVVKFFTTQTSEWGNEVSMTLYGYKKFSAPDYFPIVVDSNEQSKTNEKLEKGLQTLKNLGFTKSTTKHAKNALIIEDIFDVYTRQADQMGSYHAFVVPLSDFQKYYNFNDPEVGNLKSQLERVYGKEMEAYIENLLKDINGVGTGERELTSSLLRNVKAASVGWNLRTVIQQPTAIFRAAAEMDPRYLAKGIASKVTEKDWEQCKKYAPIAWWKDQGHFDINTGRSMKSTILGSEGKEALIDKSMDLAGKGDEIAWKHLWAAVKEEIKTLEPELEGEDYLRRCGERFGELIDKTQVVDSVFHRSWLMREKWAKLYTAFMSEPTKSYNMLYRAVADTLESRENGKFGKKEKEKLARTVTAYGVTGVLTALAASVMDAIRDDSDDDLKEKYLAALGGNIADNVNPLNMVPIVKDLVGMLQGYSSTRMDMQGFQYFVYAYNELEKFAKGESNFTTAGMIQKWLKPASMLTGVPVANLVRDTDALIETMLQVTGLETADYYKKRGKLDIRQKGNLMEYTKQAMKAYLDGNQALGNRIIKDLKAAGMEEKDIESKMKSALSENELIEAAAAAKKALDLETYEKNVAELEKTGISKEVIVEKIESVANKEETEEEEGGGKEEEEKKEEEPVSLYSMSDVIRGMELEEYDKANQVLKKIAEEKKESGKTEKEIRASVKSSLTSRFKKKYLGMKADDRAALKLQLQRLKINGKRIYEDKDFMNWTKKK